MATKKKTPKKATNFRLDADTIKKLDWLKDRYHLGTRTAALITAIGNETTRLDAPEEIRYDDWWLKNKAKKDHALISVTMTPAAFGEYSTPAADGDNRLAMLDGENITPVAVSVMPSEAEGLGLADLLCDNDPDGEIDWLILLDGLSLAD